MFAGLEIAIVAAIAIAVLVLRSLGHDRRDPVTILARTKRILLILSILLLAAAGLRGLDRLVSNEDQNAEPSFLKKFFRDYDRALQHDDME